MRRLHLPDAGMKVHAVSLCGAGTVLTQGLNQRTMRYELYAQPLEWAGRDPLPHVRPVFDSAHPFCWSSDSTGRLLHVATSDGRVRTFSRVLPVMRGGESETDGARSFSVSDHECGMSSFVATARTPIHAWKSMPQPPPLGDYMGRMRHGVLMASDMSGGASAIVRQAEHSFRLYLTGLGGYCRQVVLSQAPAVFHLTAQCFTRFGGAYWLAVSDPVSSFTDGAVWVYKWTCEDDDSDSTEDQSSPDQAGEGPIAARLDHRICCPYPASMLGVQCAWAGDNRLVVSAPCAPTPVHGAGAVFVYTREQGTGKWEVSETVTLPSRCTGTQAPLDAKLLRSLYFGTAMSVSASGSHLLVGTQIEEAGSTFLFHLEERRRDRYHHRVTLVPRIGNGVQMTHALVDDEGRVVVVNDAGHTMVYSSHEHSR